MKIKHQVSDFIVKEIYDLEYFKNKEKKDKRKFYYYFLLKKTNYEQIRAIRQIANTFRKKEKHITFCGRKDKNAITTQIICIENAKRILIQRNVDFINENIKDLDLEYLAEFPSKLYLGDNKENSFTITLRDISNNIKNESKKLINQYFLNFFSSQRFGFANNSHLIGKYLIQKNYESAFFEIFSSLPKDPSLDMIKFVDLVKNKNIEKALEIYPNIIENIKISFLYLVKNTKDFEGAINSLSQRERNFFINAYQSFVFNESLKKFDFDKNERLYLINEEENNKKNISDYENILLSLDDIKRDDFKWLNLKSNQRNVWIKIAKLYYEILDDEIFENKKKIILKFNLQSGEYATNIIEMLVAQNNWGD